jgi:16S rRNA (cytosine1402-N4)-methyltransferase
MAPHIVILLLMPDDKPVPVKPAPHRRRLRYKGKNPRRFEDKYKERDPERYGETVEKVLASGKTPAGTHRPIMVTEILEVLAPKPGDVTVDCTLGYGGHSQEILPRIQPGGFLIGLDTDPIELPKTEARLRMLGFGPESLRAKRTSYAGLPKVLTEAGLDGVDIIIVDLGVSSMQIDDPRRGFSVKLEGPLDMRMNPHKGQPAFALLGKIDVNSLATLLAENADEPKASELAMALAGNCYPTTTTFANAVRAALPKMNRDDVDRTLRRVFQALRIAVNDELPGLERALPALRDRLTPGGTLVVIAYHSGEDRIVKHAIRGWSAACICPPKQPMCTCRGRSLGTTLTRRALTASHDEVLQNPRARSARLRAWRSAE